MKKGELRVIHCGLGPIGIEAARLVSRNSMVESIGAVDISKDMSGKDLPAPHFNH
jgi:hypothetical protein